MPNKTKKKQPCRTCNQESKKMFNDEIFQSRVKVSDYRVIHKHLPELKDGKCKESSPNDANKTLNLDLGTKYKSRCLFYFAAKSKPHGQCDKINHPDYAYGDYTNTGVAKVDSKGIATIKYRCPQAYREKGFTYIPHLHFVLSEPNCEKWGNAIYTHHIFCPITKQEVDDTMAADCALLVNSLPINYFIKQSIAKSIPLPYTSFGEKDSLTEKDVDNYLTGCLAHSPKIKKAVESGKLLLKDIPMIIYCYKASCDASHKLAHHLQKMGYTNLKHYKGGILDYFK